MAQGTRGPAAATMPANGAVVHNPPSTAINRKKQKRREKEAAKKAAQDVSAPAVSKSTQSTPAPNLQAAQARQPAPQYQHPELDDPPYDDDAEFYSDEEVEHYEHAYGTNGHYQQPYTQSQVSTRTGKKSRKKKKAPTAASQLHYPPQLPPHHEPSSTTSAARAGSKKDRIWNTSTQEERERIREFWLSLGEEERKSLVKIEKEAVLRKMKEQQKHSCSCTVCGRKRTAIEEELEVLYDAYYEELEQYVNHQPFFSSVMPEANHRYASSAPSSRQMLNTHPPGHYDDDDDEYSGDEDYSNSEISSEEGYSSEERSLPPPEASDFLHFGSSLQVKGILKQTQSIDCANSDQAAY